MTISRQVKLLKIGQAHLAQNMDLIKWREIVNKYPTLSGRLDSLPDEDIDRIIAEIGEFVRGHKFGNKPGQPG
jgi:hypothetical protein